MSYILLSGVATPDRAMGVVPGRGSVTRLSLGTIGNIGLTFYQ